MKKKEKTINNSVPVEKSTKIWNEEYRDIRSLNKKNVTEQWIEDRFVEMVNWAIDDKDALKISQFFKKRGIARTTMEYWRDKFPRCKELYSEALDAIGNNREIGAIKKKYSEGMIATTMAHYDKDWKALAEWKASLARKEEDKENKQVIVVMKDFPRCDVVKGKE